MTTDATTNPTPLAAFQVQAINDGFPWECACGELHRTLDYAWSCRKCRQYLSDADHADRTTIDLRTGRTHYRPGQDRGWANYLLMSWTSRTDECEAACGTTMAAGRYVEGSLGHYCSKACRSASEDGHYEDPRAEARQMGITAL